MSRIILLKVGRRHVTRYTWQSVLIVIGVTLETGRLGTAAGLFSLPTGYALAVSAALLAGIYPAIRMGRMIPSEAMRSE